jgi:hypothetical protein
VEQKKHVCRPPTESHMIATVKGVIGKEDAKQGTKPEQRTLLR